MPWLMTGQAAHALLQVLVKVARAIYDGRVMSNFCG